MMDYGQAATSWNQYAVDNNLAPEQTQAGLDKLTKGDLPEGANIAKAIVDGYMDGVLITGAAYLGPAPSIGKVVAGATIAEIANGSYQWFDIKSEQNQSLPENQRKTWDYWSSGSAALTGMLAPGRGIWQNVGIAAAGSVFTDGPDVGAVGSSAAGAALGGAFGKYAPAGVDKIMGDNKIPDVVYDYWGGVASEFSSVLIKEITKPKSDKEDKK